ncbi:MAG: RHS repeat-associated core domain-containing protein [Bacteroidales bacterium]|nr:RHS repeat-associated core domain-containing protein [Bacteroidales bacterium]
MWRNLDQHPRFAGTYTFSAKEKDAETGYSYFGSRYYSSDLSVWLSVDPMAAKYPSLSPYVYCADNPVRLVDPDGAEVWIPEVTDNGDIRLLYEEGDDYQSLTDFLGGDLGIFSKRQIDKMWNNRDENGNVILSKNIFSKAIKNAIKLNYPPEEDILKYDDWAAAEKAGYRKNYNCFSAAMDAAMGDELGCGLVKDLDEDLEYGKWYSTNAPVFGKTLLRFEYKGKATHSATYFGKDHSGNTYVFTKNGPFPAPKIMLLQDVENIPGYGTVTPLRTDTKRLQGNSGMYNYGY